MSTLPAERPSSGIAISTTSTSSIPEFDTASTQTHAPENLLNRWFWTGIGLVLASCLLVYWDSFSWMAQTWMSDSDYSHGFFVAPFAIYVWSMRKPALALLREESSAASQRHSVILGAALMGVALVLRGVFRYVRMDAPESLTFLLFILGGMVAYFGIRSIPIVFSGVLFLVFMIPLPGSLASQLSGVLQNVATQVSTFAFQTIGIPAFAQGNVISLTSGQIGVAEACSGIRMLYSFFALTFGACLIMERTFLEKVIISSLAPFLAVAANCLRIIATGVAFEYGDPKSAEHFFHDIAGWFMMPVGFGLLMVVLAILDRVLEVDPPAIESARR